MAAINAETEFVFAREPSTLQRIKHRAGAGKESQSALTAGSADRCTVVRSGTSFRNHESANGMIAIASPQRKTPFSAWENACRNWAWTSGGSCFACSGLMWTPPARYLRRAGRQEPELVGEARGEDRAEERDAEGAADRAEERRGRGRDAHVLRRARRSGRRARAPASRGRSRRRRRPCTPRRARARCRRRAARAASMPTTSSAVPAIGNDLVAADPADHPARTRSRRRAGPAISGIIAQAGLGRRCSRRRAGGRAG